MIISTKHLQENKLFFFFIFLKNIFLFKILDIQTEPYCYSDFLKSQNVFHYLDLIMPMFCWFSDFVPHKRGKCGSPAIISCKRIKQTHPFFPNQRLILQIESKLITRGISSMDYHKRNIVQRHKQILLVLIFQ